MSLSVGPEGRLDRGPQDSLIHTSRSGFLCDERCLIKRSHQGRVASNVSLKLFEKNHVSPSQVVLILVLISTPPATNKVLRPHLVYRLVSSNTRTSLYGGHEWSDDDSHRWKKKKKDKFDNAEDATEKTTVTRELSVCPGRSWDRLKAFLLPRCKFFSTWQVMCHQTSKKLYFIYRGPVISASFGNTRLRGLTCAGRRSGVESDNEARNHSRLTVV